MKAITLWQPWASLISLNVKTIETRGWATRHRGPLAIHAAKRPPDFAVMKNLIAGNDDAWDAWHSAGLVSPDGELDDVPLGAVVATCTLVDCVQMLAGTEQLAREPQRPSLVISGSNLTYYPDAINTGVDVDDQAPYGDYQPGRFGWVLTDVVRLDEPIPAKGRQQLWNWEPE